MAHEKRVADWETACAAERGELDIARSDIAAARGELDIARAAHQTQHDERMAALEERDRAAEKRRADIAELETGYLNKLAKLREIVG